jgi:hypothetical protein
MPHPPPVKEIHLHPSIKQPELQPRTDRAPPTQQPVMRLLRIVHLVAFFWEECLEH